jgi:hypothetical protein
MPFVLSAQVLDVAAILRNWVVDLLMGAHPNIEILYVMTLS